MKKWFCISSCNQYYEQNFVIQCILHQLTYRSAWSERSPAQFTLNYYVPTDTHCIRKKKVFIINRFTIISIEYIDFMVCNIVLIKSFVCYGVLTDEKFPKS